MQALNGQGLCNSNWEIRYMRKILIATAAVALLALSMPAFADSTSGDQTNTNTQTVGAVTNTANGGNGGAGGSVDNSGNNSNTNTNTANSNASAGASAGAVANTTNHNSNVQGQKQGQGQSQSQGNSAVGQGNTTSVTSQYTAAAGTAYSAPLVASPDTCMGSSSMGGQGMTFGFSLGSTWTDENCERLKNSRELRKAGFARAANALLCMNSDVRDAMKVAGTLCPQDQVVKSASITIEQLPAHTAYEQPRAKQARPAAYLPSDYNPAAGRY